MLTEDSSKVSMHAEMKMSETEWNLLKTCGSGPITAPPKPKRMANYLPRGPSARKTVHGVSSGDLEAGKQALKPISKPLEYDIPTSAGILRYHGFPPRAAIKSGRKEHFPQTESSMTYNGRLNRSIRGYLFSNPVYNLPTPRTKEQYLHRLPFNHPGRRRTSTQSLTPGPFGWGPVLSAPLSKYSTTSSAYTPSSPSNSEHGSNDLRNFQTNRRPITGSTPNSTAFRHIRAPFNAADHQPGIGRAVTSPFISFPRFSSGAPHSGPFEPVAAKSPCSNGQFPNRSCQTTYGDDLCKGFSGIDQVQRDLRLLTLTHPLTTIRNWLLNIGIFSLQPHTQLHTLLFTLPHTPTCSLPNSPLILTSKKTKMGKNILTNDNCAPRGRYHYKKGRRECAVGALFGEEYTAGTGVGQEGKGCRSLG